MNNLQPLKWKDEADRSEVQHELFKYRVIPDHDSEGKFAVRYKDSNERPATGFATMGDAKEWAWDNYNEKMQPYVKPDSITDIANWFKAAKPEPTIEDLCVQVGCCIEEFAELLQGFGMTDLTNYSVYTIITLADSFKNKEPERLAMLNSLSDKQRIDIVDACCDINVTSVGIMQLLGGVDVLGAQREVIRSNNSKMVKGKFEFDDNGKIMKPGSYSKPDLTPFVSTTQNNKGE